MQQIPVDQLAWAVFYILGTQNKLYPETFYYNLAKIVLISIKIGTQPAYDVIK